MPTNQGGGTINMELHKTKGMVFRTVKYGETSLIVTVYTELFGVQSYLVNGVRASTKKGPGRANLFQPAAILDLIVYHNDLKHLQRIREFKWGYLYRHIFFDVIKNAVALFMVELLQKCLKQPEPNADLFYFIEDAFIHLDEAEGPVLANFPLFFTLHLAGFFWIPYPGHLVGEPSDTGLTGRGIRRGASSPSSLFGRQLCLYHLAAAAGKAARGAQRAVAESGHPPSFAVGLPELLCAACA